jgi:hypothetical protein
MNVYPLLKQQLLRARRHQSYRRIYRRSCLPSAYASSDRCLLAMLAGGVVLIVLTTLQHVLWAAEKQLLDQPPPRMTSNLPAMRLLPEVNLQAKNADTLFKPVKQPVPSLEQHAQPEKSSLKTAVAAAHKRPWQLQIVRPAVAVALMSAEIDDGYRHLRVGQLPLARQVFLTALTHDSHSVEAMEGMLLIARQVGDSQSEADYLDRLRLEIPFYEHDSASHAHLEQGQD